MSFTQSSLLNIRKSSLLAAPPKCNSVHPQQRIALARKNCDAAEGAAVKLHLQGSADTTLPGHAKTFHAPLALTLPAASCTMNCSGRLAQLVRAPALQAGGRRFEPCTAHHPPLAQVSRLGSTHRGDVVQLVRTLPRHWLESHTVTAKINLRSPQRTNPLRPYSGQPDVFDGDSGCAWPFSLDCAASEVLARLFATYHAAPTCACVVSCDFF